VTEQERALTYQKQAKDRAKFEAALAKLLAGDKQARKALAVKWAPLTDPPGKIL
jgi:hypothetical protein